MDNQPIKNTLYNRSNANKPQKEITPIHIAILAFIIIAFFLLIFSLSQIFQKNPYGEQIKIDNFDRYFKSVTTDTKQSIYNTLYNIARINATEDTVIPKKGAKIRDGSTTESYNSETRIYVDYFIVDIEELRQSYSFQVTWSPKADNPNLDGGYPIVATCVAEDQAIYPEFHCKDGFETGINVDPVMTILPLEISSYNDDYSRYTAYTIDAKVDDDSITIIITDETGGNYDSALSLLRQKGIDLSKYHIVYYPPEDILSPGRAPNNADL